MLSMQTPEKLASILSNYWEVISENTGLSSAEIAEQALIAPARCCLVDVTIDSSERTKTSNIEERLVEKAFSFLSEISQILKEKFVS
jgi:hypothetical protein